MSNIRIISTSDVHGKVLPHSYADGRELDSGFAKLATLIEGLRRENTILIDNGDTLDGSPLQSYYYAQQRAAHGSAAEAAADDGVTTMLATSAESPVSKAMSLMWYDYINIGNHDFDYGIEELERHIDATGAKCVNLNIGCDYDVKEIAGIRIAVFGVLTHFTPHWESEGKLGGAAFPDTFTLVKETVEIIKREEDPDYIVCCYHGGLERNPETGEETAKDNGENQGYKMLSEIDDLDVLIMGHQHTLSAGVYKGEAYSQPGVSGPGGYKCKAYSQSGVDGNYISVIDIDTDGGGMEVKLVSLAEEKPEPSAEIVEAMEPYEEACQAWLDMPIGKSKIDLRVMDEDDARLNKSQFITFINKVQRDRLGGDISATSLFLGATGLGEIITMRDLVSSYAFPNTLVKKRISGRVLKEYLEKTLEFWRVEDGKIVIAPEYLHPIPQHFNYDIFDGIEYEAEISRPKGSRLTALMKDGKPIGDEEEFTIVLNNYRAAGGGDYPMLAELETLEEDLTNMVDVLAEYIEKHGEIDFEPVYNVHIRV